MPDQMLMQAGSKTLVDIRSRPFALLDCILNVLDETEEIILVQTSTGTLEAELSRLRLKFFVNSDGRVVSKEFGAFVDSTQRIGCLYGLVDKLVLIDSSNARCVIIPYGEPVVTRKGYHVSLKVKRPEGDRVKYMVYSMDTHLQILRCSDSLAALYQAYLHALTSFPVPDHFTHRSGTAEAIRILRQGCLRSSFPPNSDCIKNLKRIAALTPVRVFYPPKPRVMQTVAWSGNLGQLAQDDDFQPLSLEILEFADQFSSFHVTEPRARQVSYAGSMNLLERARCRNEQLRCAEVGGPPSLCTKKTYPSRDQDIRSPRSNSVYELTALVRDWPSAVNHSSNVVETMRKFTNVSTHSPNLSHSSCSQLMGLSTESDWVALYNFCRSKSRSRDTYSLISVFAKVGFGGIIDQSVLLQLLSIAFSASCREIPWPCSQVTSFDLTMGEDFDIRKIEDAIWECYTPFTPSTDHTRPNQFQADTDARKEWADRRRQVVGYCGRHIQDQWPTRTPGLPSQSSVSLVRREAAQQKCQSLCSTWVQNGEFLGFLRQVQDKAPPSGNGKAKAQAISNPPTCCNDVEHSLFKPPGIIELIQESPLMGHEAECVSFTYRGASLIPRPTPELRALAEYFKTNSDICKQGYGNELARSIQALEALSNSAAEAEDPEGCVSFNWQEARSEIVSHQQGLKTQRDTLWGVIIAALRDGYSIVGFDTVCPSITVWSVLAVLGSDQWTMIPDQWRLLLVAFGKSISTLRRCERLISCIDMRDLDGFFKEAENPGYEGWEPSAHPTWLLLELEQNITIRKRQVEVAGQIIQPDCDGNALLQLNMGEGKTTVITGMTVVHLADGRILVRLIVLKPLLRQSVNDLSQRLGGLINRRIYHIPVSRNTELDDSTIRKLQSIYGKCLRDRGILIALPEHILSFRLLGLDAAESSPNIYPSLIKFEHWLQLHCRDIIDESDEVLDTKFQLVYTMGTQKSMDGLSSRWETTQDLLRLVSTQAKRLHQDDPNCIEVDQTGYRYPLLRFLEDDAIGRLLRYILQEISENGIPGLPFNQWTTKVKSSALKFIKDLELSKEDEATVRGEFKDGVFITKLLVLRGHFAYGLLRFSLANKRWLVEYGLHPLRCFMAVPYRAKGVPSDNAEFGHPDVAVTLTCLSYYYEGLQEKQLRTCFLLLAKENDPSTVYHNWVAQCVHDLPFSLRTYSGVNLEDGMAFKKVLFPILRYQKEILDFYLSRVVFSREAKEFPRKLSSSAWDIPAQRGLQLTTGFSGTNDNRSLLPLSICQRDLPDLLHTNAMVLGYLLRDCNRQCVMAQDEKGHQLGVDQLLKLVLSCGERSSTAQPVRVLIDVGAQILEAGNQSVAEKWLSITTVDEVQAAIFFNENDELMVIDRDGLIETLLSSPFRQRLGACLVFLDQHHSRGVDLKLPPTTRAAVTLGPRLTKDKLVQVTTVSGAPRDVLRWSMLQTCDALDNLRPLWANQGLQYYRKIALWDLLVKESNASTQVAVSMQEPEAKTLLQHYLPSDADRLSVLDDTAPNDSNIEDVRVLLNALRSTTGQSVSSAYLHEEQEREIACEVERERQVARPPNYIPHQHRLHEDIEYFAKFGKFPGDHPSRSALTLAFEGLANTSVGDTQYPNGLGPGLYSSWDFIQTVQVREHDMEDEFSKPPHWVLSSVHNNDLVIVSQYEANAVLPIVRQSKHTRLNIYTARFTKPMRSFGNLDFFGIGSGCPMPTQRMRCCLELFAGSLYFDNFEEYKYFRYFLGLLTENYENIPQEGITSEGFVEFFTRFRLRWPLDSPFMVNPLPFLAALVDIRTRGGGYQQSHVGSVIRAIQLTPETF
ncbi:uncharacterized protein N7515_007967 [Penicillium bovifimosum]|uniref:ubiquitinyl hydrolase 1 n=1 Tax=Penicillium bovifimosum TaxID=126998 RepID=A0A9W9GN81_9EURO|nr:uncharacterized protein N7515_007967 [Penicillium bovifimosum]KAJ5124142.1 hypothetical protein N7515_007967 [Penicillium bovifimosum]